MSRDDGLGGDYEQCSHCGQPINTERTPYAVVRDVCANKEHYLHFNQCFHFFNILHDFEVIEIERSIR
jgi:hypothetical protein